MKMHIKISEMLYFVLLPKAIQGLFYISGGKEKYAENRKSHQHKVRGILLETHCLFFVYF